MYIATLAPTAALEFAKFSLAIFLTFVKRIHLQLKVVEVVLDGGGSYTLT